MSQNFNHLHENCSFHEILKRCDKCSKLSKLVTHTAKPTCRSTRHVIDMMKSIIEIRAFYKRFIEFINLLYQSKHRQSFNIQEAHLKALAATTMTTDRHRCQPSPE